MPLSIKPKSTIVASVKTYVRAQEAFKNLDLTTWSRGLLGGIVEGLGLAFHDWYLKLKDYADNDPFPQTARGTFLTGGWWVPITGLTQTQATAASGLVCVPGVAGSILAKNAELIIGGRSYTAKQAATVLNQQMVANSLTFDGAQAIFETSSDHGYATGLSVTISGADQSEFNGTFEIAVTAGNEFTFTPSGAPVSPATGSIMATSTHAAVNVVAFDVGQSTNIEAANRLQIVDDIAGLDGYAIVTFGEIAGGSDLEDPEDFRERILEALGATLGMFTDSEISTVVKGVPGVTRVWVRKAQEVPDPGWPEEGQTRVAFMRDKDANPFPSAQEVATAKASLVENDETKILPAHMVETNLMLFSPTPKPVDFAFTSIVPDTPGIRLSIAANLKQFFEEDVQFGSDYPKEPDPTLYEEEYKCAIKRAADPDTGQGLRAFDLSTPVGDIVPLPDELPTLGSVVLSS